MTQCVACHQPLDPVLAQTQAIHPSCLSFFPEAGVTLADQLKRELTEMIIWADRNSARSLQAEPGPSELGTPCDRRIAYRLAQVPAVNLHWDRLPAIIGTAMHRWLEDGVQRWSKAHGSTGWGTEKRVAVDEFISGNSDLFHYYNGVVIDWKTASADIMKKVKEDLSLHKPEYIIQIMLYGLGYEKAGLTVTDVALVFIPRAGRLRDMYVWTVPYDRTIAEFALSRMYRIAQEIVDLDVINNQHRFEQIQAVGGNHCGFCPWFNPDKVLETGADQRGCPGR